MERRAAASEVAARHPAVEFSLRLRPGPLGLAVRGRGRFLVRDPPPLDPGPRLGGLARILRDSAGGWGGGASRPGWRARLLLESSLLFPRTLLHDGRSLPRRRELGSPVLRPLGDTRSTVVARAGRLLRDGRLPRASARTGRALRPRRLPRAVPTCAAAPARGR